MARPTSPALRIWTLISFLCAICAGALLFAPNKPLIAGLNMWPVALLVTVAFAVMEVVVFDVPFGSERHTVSWNETVVVLGMIVLSPRILAACFAIGGGTMLCFYRKQTSVRLVFNLAQATCTISIGALIARVFTDWFTRFESWGPVSGPWVGAFFGAVCAGVLSALLVGFVVSLAERESLNLQRAFGVPTIAVIASASGGVTLGVCVKQNQLLGAFPLLLFFVFALVFRSYAGVKTRNEESTILNDATLALENAVEDVLQGRSDAQTSVTQLLNATCRSLHVRKAMLIENFDEDRWITHWIDRSEFGVPLHSTISERPTWLPDNLEAGERRIDPLGDDQICDALVAPVRSDRGVIGAIVATSRAQNFGAIGDVDLSLIQTATNLLSLHLRSGELRRRLQTLHVSESELRQLAHHDELTGLANRRQLESHETGVAIATRADHYASIALIDLDRFKEINDTYGHALGDELLVKVAEILSSITVDGDLPVRLGGDEFAFLSATHPAVLRDRLTKALGVTVTCDGIDVSIGSSIGVATLDLGFRHCADEELATGYRLALDRALSGADLEMYQVKSAHKTASTANTANAANAASDAGPPLVDAPTAIDSKDLARDLR